MEEKLTKKERRLIRKEEKRAARDAQAKKSSFARISAWGIGIAVIVGAVFALIKLSEPPKTETGEVITASSINETDHVKGSESQSITVIEYGDFQCPACGTFYPVVKKLAEEFGDKVTFVYRHFPLSQIHQNARISSLASEAAAMQGKFWEMHDILFENQEEWSNLANPRSKFEEYAAEIGLDIEKYKSDIDSEAAKNKVDNDYSSGIKSGVNSTPSFFLDGKKITHPGSLGEFRNVLENRINEASE